MLCDRLGTSWSAAGRVHVSDSLYERIYEVTSRIPRGKVATYGQIARVAGVPKGARQVGYAMAALGRGRPRPDVPWHRVVNAKGESSIGGEQVARLESEGVAFDAQGRIDLRRFGWSDVEEGGLFG
jgi:methylated-DNA-protein-cysteine methyltransferase-like protein